MSSKKTKNNKFNSTYISTKKKTNSTCKGLRESGVFFQSCPLLVVKGRGRNLPTSDPETKMMFAAKKSETLNNSLKYLI